MYDLIYADPPWYYSPSEINPPYPLIKHNQLLELNIKDITNENCVLFLWTTGPRMDIAIECIKKWGFRYCTVGFVWNKTRPTYGAYTHSQCEYCLIGMKGKLRDIFPMRNPATMQYLEQPSHTHSKKPIEVYKRIETLFPKTKKIELFARQKRENWDAWGNEIETVSNVDHILKL